ncbi:MAG: ribonuclease H family protein [Chloroflexi bacterium]|nr:ribonuclease H family protein [Chloroflexota bacterium]
MTAKAHYYVVWKGRRSGVFSSWEECRAQVDGYPGAQYKGFAFLREAKQAVKRSYADYVQSNGRTEGQARIVQAALIAESYSVDAACSGSPGRLEYRGVYTPTRKEIFHMGPFPQGTNNIGEFLALVHALNYLKQKKINAPIYSDSRNAIGWVRQKRCKTTLIENKVNAPLFELIRRAEAWLRENNVENPILKWPTHLWGEIPADFGRK